MSNRALKQKSEPMPVNTSSQTLPTQLGKTKRGQERIESLIKAATDCFLEYGYENTSLDKIIERSGGSRSTIYNIFKGKEGLFAAIIEQLIDEIYSEIPKNIVADTTLTALFRQFGTVFLKKMLMPKSIGLYRLIIAESVRFPELGENFYQYGPQRIYRYLAQQLMQSKQLPLNEEQCLEIAALYLEMLKSDLFMKALSVPDYQPSQSQIETQVALCTAIVCHYIVGKDDIHP